MKIDLDDDVCLVRPQGKLDSSNSGAFEKTLEQILTDQKTNLIIDLEQVTFVASAGLRVILNISKTLAQEGCALRIFGLNGLVRETFEISGFVSIVDVRQSESHAREGLGC